MENIPKEQEYNIVFHADRKHANEHRSEYNAPLDHLTSNIQSAERYFSALANFARVNIPKKYFIKTQSLLK